MSSRLLAHAGCQPLHFPPPSLYTKNAVAFFAPGSPVGLAPAESVPEDRVTHCFRSIPGRYGMRLKDEAVVYRGADVRSAKPRGAAPECRAELRPPRHRATSHNGARYAFVRSKTRSHVALSGAPPRCLQAEKSGSRARHTFRPSGNPTGWNRKRSVPLALLLVNPGVMGCANVAAKRYAARKSGLSALAGEPPEARFPSAVRFKLPVSGPKTARPSSASSGRHSPLPPNSCHGICLRTCRASPGRSAWQRPRQHEACCHVLCWPLHGCGRRPEDVAALMTLRFPSPEGVGAWKTKLC